MYDSIIIGAGFFGLYLAQHLAREHNHRVLILEKNQEVMKRASYVNQARVHNGYHYPRDLLTAKRSARFYPRFIDEFKDAIFDDFEAYYAIGGVLGKVSAQQFYSFAKFVSIPIEPASPVVKRHFRENLIDEVFLTREVAFDANKLKGIALDLLEDKKVELKTGTRASHLKKSTNGIIVSTSVGDYVGENVYNCTYSQLNQILNGSGLPLLDVKHEITEICLVEPPKEFSKIGITVMCGPFFSTMPFPPENCHSFSHVRYTPQGEYFESKDNYQEPSEIFKSLALKTAWNKMKKDAQRYVPLLAECQYKKSLFEVKTVLPRNEVNDGRPILYQPDYFLEGFHCILGGKIDNIYDMISLTDQLIEGGH